MSAARAVAAPRVGVVGGRRTRQGLGPFVARDLIAAGAHVPCFLVARAASIEPARAEIERLAGVSPKGYLDPDEMLDAEPLDALAILSPSGTHAAHLLRAAEHGLPTLCEKPLVWGEPQRLGEQAAEITAAFDARRLLLVENCQWPLVLPAFARLHPGALDAPPRRFRMELEPSSHGLEALGDALSHPLSVLQTLLPGPDPALRGVCFEPGASSAEPLTVRFHYESAGCSCEVTVVLGHGTRQPRHAAIELDGRRARRVVAPEDYRLSFIASNRSVPLEDPLTLLVADFIRCLRAPDEALRRARSRDIDRRMQLLSELVRAYSQQEPP